MPDEYYYVITLQSLLRDGTTTTTTHANTYRVSPGETRGQAFAAVYNESLARDRAQMSTVLFWSFEPNSLD